MFGYVRLCLNMLGVWIHEDLYCISHIVCKHMKACCDNEDDGAMVIAMMGEWWYCW